jgi:membrane associated rhomboid family serine protease
MLIPIGQESDKVRRVPWVTIAIMGLCVLIHILSSGAVSEYEYDLSDIKNEIYQYYMSHPYLELDEKIKKSFFLSEEMEEVIETMAADKYGAAPSEQQVEEEQAYLDNLVEELHYVETRHPFYKYGLVPQKKTFVGLIGHMFLHAGWFHLLGNLLFLYIMGPFIEDSWGKPAYAVFYLATGIMAALAFAMHYPNSAVPMIGASGAISGVMGGFLIRHWNARIRYFYMFSILIRGTFSAPAWVMLPMGFIMDVFSASMMDSIAPEGGGGVAHWAHVWGFVFGIAGAFLIKYLKIEEKFVAPKVEAETTYVNKSFVAYEEAMQVLADGDKEKAYTILIDAAKQDPSNQDVIEALWNIASETGRTGEVAPFLTRLVEREVQQDQLEPALFHYRQLRSKYPDARFATHTKIKIFEQAVIIKDANEANDIFKELIREVNLASPPGVVTELCNAALKFDLTFNRSLAGKVIELALQHPEIPDDRKKLLKQQLYALPKQEEDAPIKVNSKSDMGDVSGVGTASGASSLLVPLVAAAPKNPSAPQEPAIPVTPSQPPPIIDEPTIPVTLQELTIPAAPYQSQPPPIPEESTIPVTLQEPEIPITPYQSQPPPIIEEPTIPVTPYQSPTPPSFEEPTIPVMPREPEIPIMPYQAESPPPIEPIIPIVPNEPATPTPPGEPGTPVRPVPSAEDMVTPPPPPAPRKRFRVTKAVPLYVKGGKIGLDVKDMGKRVFALEKIKAIAVVKISPPGERPFLLIDLLVDDPGAAADATAREVVIRTLRLFSTTFNPQKFVAQTESPLQAFKIFTSSLLRLSKAKPFPNEESVQLKKVTGYRSIKEYEDSFLNAEGM